MRAQAALRRHPVDAYSAERVATRAADLTILIATVARLYVPVVALLAAVDNTVATPGSGAVCSTSALFGVGVAHAIVTFLIRISYAIAALGGRAVRPTSIRFGVGVVGPVVALLEFGAHLAIATCVTRTRSRAVRVAGSAAVGEPVVALLASSCIKRAVPAFGRLAHKLSSRNAFQVPLNIAAEILER